MSLSDNFKKHPYLQYPYQNNSLKDMDGEIWKPLLNYETYYEVSNLGRIKSIPRERKHTLRGTAFEYKTRTMIRKQQKKTDGKLHLYFSMGFGRRITIMYVSYAVYTTFIGEFNIENYQLVHIDNDVYNNRVENLTLLARKKMRCTIIRKEMLNNDFVRKLRGIELTDKQKNLLNTNDYPFLNFSLEDMEGEVWRKLPFYEEYIEVSNMGRVKRLSQLNKRNGMLRTINDRIVKQTFTIRRPPLRIMLSFQTTITYIDYTENNQSIKINFLTTGAICSAFPELVNYNGKSFEISFKDSDPLNIRLDNLYMEAHSKKINYTPYKRKRMTPEICHRKRVNSSSEKEVSQFDSRGNYIRTFPGVADAAKALDISCSLISAVLNKSLKAKGFFWCSGNDRSPICEEVIEMLNRNNSRRGKPVEQYTSTGKYITTYPSITDAARHIGCTSNNIRHVVKGKKETVKGFIFRFA